MNRKTVISLISAGVIAIAGGICTAVCLIRKKKKKD